MEIIIFEEPESLPFPGFRYRLRIFSDGREFVALVSTCVFSNRDDAWVAALGDYDDFMGIEPMSENLEYIRQVHEEFLTQLEGLAVEAIASGDWSKVRDLINDFRRDESDAID